MVFKPKYRAKSNGEKLTSKNWWFKFMWKGKLIRESTGQTNKRVAEQMEATRKTELVTGVALTNNRKRVPTLKAFAEDRFLPYVRSQFSAKPKTASYYENGVKALVANPSLADTALDLVTVEQVSAHAGERRGSGLKISTVNRQLQVLKRVLHLAVDWGAVEKAVPKIQLLPGEARRERVLTADEEDAHLRAADALGSIITDRYAAATVGLRATKRGETPVKPRDPYLLRDMLTVLIDCGLRPEECFRLKRANVKQDLIEVHFGKTDSARRKIPMSDRVSAILQRRLTEVDSEWVFPAPTQSGHAEPSTVKHLHAKALEMTGAEPFVLYTLRHTCLTRWAAYMDPYTLAYLAGHASFVTTKRYVHPEMHTVRLQMDKARVAKDGSRFSKVAAMAMSGAA